MVAMLIFGIWNVSTARRRGRVFVKLRPMIKSVEPKDFKTAIILNIVFIFLVAIVAVWRVVVFCYYGRVV